MIKFIINQIYGRQSNFDFKFQHASRFVCQTGKGGAFMNYGVIYLIWNMLNGKKYVGQTKLTVKERFNQHAKCKKSLIGKAIHKYGRKNFRYGVIEICDTLEQLNECEKYWITALRCKSPVGYNRTDGGFNSGGHKQSAKTRAKIGLANKGEKNGFYGKHHTKEHCEAMSARQKGVPKPPEQVAKSAAGNRGKKRSEEFKLLMSKVHKGKPLSHEHSLKIGAANRKKSPFKNLLTEMDKRQLSYKELARLLELSTSTISNRMHGLFNFTGKDIAKLVEIFGKPLEYLIARVDD